MTIVKIKKQKTQKRCHKKTLKFQDYKNSLEATRLENKLNHLEKMKMM